MSAHVTNDLRNGAASIFPNAGQVVARGTFSDVRTEPNVGLTKRELFAAMAMQSLIAKAPVHELLASDPGRLPAMCALGAVDYADALLTALENVK